MHRTPSETEESPFCLHVLSALKGNGAGTGSNRPQLFRTRALEAEITGPLCMCVNQVPLFNDGDRRCRETVGAVGAGVAD